MFFIDQLSIRLRMEIEHTVPYGVAQVTSDKLSREAWADAALDAIGRGGLAAVAVEPIASMLGVTKGSFYWHFRDRRELLDAALTRWEQRATADIIEQLTPIGDPVARLRRLFVIAFGEGPEEVIEDAILGSLTDPTVAKVVGRVNEARLNFLIGSFRELGFAPQVAKHRARIAYAALLGHRRLQGGVSSRIGASATKSFGVELIDALTSDARSD
jgi:AcrR family transcriptional regulator